MQRAIAPLDALWQAPALIWILIVGQALAIVLALSPGIEGSRWVALGLYSLAVQWTSLTALSFVYALRRILRAWRSWATALVAFFALVASALVIATVGRTFFPVDAPVAQASTADFLLRTGIIAATAGLLGLAAFHNYWLSRQSATRAKQAELEALQARIHPHFLFNTLNSAATLVHARPDDAESVLLDLSDLFRAALSEPGWVPLAHEIGLCRRYLGIEQLRFGDRLVVDWDVNVELERLSVPLLVVQPLLENAIAHGFDEESGRKRLRIEVRETTAELQVSVSNAIPKTPLENPNGHRIGLAALRARLQAATHGMGQLETLSNDGQFVAHLVVPKSTMPETGQATIS